MYRSQKDNRLLIISSNLGGNLWDGCLNMLSADDDFNKSLYTSRVSKELISASADGCWVNDELIVVGTDEGYVELLQQEDQFFIDQAKLTQHDSFVTSVSVNSDQTLILSGAADSHIQVCDVATSSLESIFRQHHRDIINQVKFHTADHNLFTSCSMDGLARIWDLRKSNSAQRLDCRGSIVMSQCYTEKHIIQSYQNGHISISDIRNLTNPIKLLYKVHTKTPKRLALHPTRDLVASCGEDGRVSVIKIDPVNTHIIYNKKAHTDFVSGLTWIGDELLSCGYDSQLIKHTELTKLLQES